MNRPSPLKAPLKVQVSWAPLGAGTDRGQSGGWRQLPGWYDMPATLPTPGMGAAYCKSALLQELSIYVCIILFMYLLLAMLGLRSAPGLSLDAGFSRQRPLFPAEHRLRNCGRRLSCQVASGIFPDQGLNPHLLHWLVGSLPLRRSPEIFFFNGAFKINK